MARLITLVWDVPGHCDLSAMTQAITAHLRRQDTYGSRFAFDERDRPVRHQVEDRTALEVEPVVLGTLDAAAWRARVESIPGPLDWDCFGFGVIQRADHFTVWASVDHLHADGSSVMLLYRELHDTYTSLRSGGGAPPLPDAGSYLDFCRRQAVEVSAFRRDSSPVRAWLSFLARNGGALPHFPLDLGGRQEAGMTDVATAPLLDATASGRFEAACAAAGARPLGGLLACAALTERALTGSRSYAVITPTTTRSFPADNSTSGWFTGVVPILLEDTAARFDVLARAAQTVYAEGVPLARVPIERVLELAGPPVAPVVSGIPMLSYLDTSLLPMDADVMIRWERHRGRLLLNRGAAHQVGLWVTRTPSGMTLSVAVPDNAVARDSIARYTSTLRAIVAQVAAGVDV